MGRVGDRVGGLIGRALMPDRLSDPRGQGLDRRRREPRYAFTPVGPSSAPLHPTCCGYGRSTSNPAPPN